MLKQRIPAFYLLIAAVTGGLLVLIAIMIATRKPTTDNETEADAGYNIIRYKSEFKYISPIISVEPIRESDRYTSLKEKIINYIEIQKKTGLISASVYMREFAKGDWMAIDAGEKYDPGSLLKVGVLITYFKMAEPDSGLLSKQVVYHGQKGFVFPIEHYRADTVKEGETYTIRGLMTSMIRNSDNRATLFLEDHMDTAQFKKEFADLGMAEPDFRNPAYQLNVKEYSMLFKALYNAGYLRSRRSSDRALELLTQSAFKDGITKELPASLVVAHKFGEAGDRNVHELHEAGIVYLQNKPYLITVMTKGTDWDKLSQTISHISRMVYDHMVSQPN